MNTRSLSAGLFAMLFLAGCGGPEVTEVTGQVLLQGQPFDEGSVVFWPKEDLTLGVFTAFRCNKDGTFKINPEPEHGEGKPGLYAVLIRDLGFNLRSKILPKYKDLKTTPFTVEIEPGVSDLEPFDLERNPDADRPFVRPIPKMPEEK